MLAHARVLVADDDLELLTSVAEALERSGAKVVRAESGAQLIERMADEGPFELVITDISMPWMSGLQAMHSARFAGLATPVIVMTALDEDRLPEQVRALGPNTTLLRKPFGLSDLATAAEALLSAAPQPADASGAAGSLAAPDSAEPVTKWLEVVAEHLGEGIVLLDAQGRIVFQNRAALLLSAQEPRDRDRFGNLMPFDFRQPSGERVLPEDCPYVRALLHDERVPGRELATRAVDGRLLPVLVSALPIRNAAGKLLGAAMIVEDISHLKALERFREGWVSRVAHDLRQPINTIVLTSDLLLQTESSAEQRERVARVRASARRLGRMVSQLSDAFQVESHRVTLFRERLDLGALVQDVSARSSEVAGKVRVSVPADRHLFVQGDPGRLERALTTLLSCAMSRPGADSPEPRVGVSLEECDGVAEVTVVGGHGLLPDDLAVAFGARAPSSATARGAGVGLYIAKGFIEAHGGKLWAEQLPDDATAFRLTLPLDGPPLRVEAPHEPEQADATRR
jgi:PAS domain S-box-containing protein